MATLVSAGLSFCRLISCPVKAQLSFTRAHTCMNENEPVSFPDWKAALARSDLSPSVQASHSREILTLLHHCKKCHTPVSVAFIKQWLAGPRLQVQLKGMPAGTDQAREALRWFYRAAPKADGLEDVQSSASGVRAPPDRASVLGTSRSTSDSRSYYQRPAWRPMEPRPAAQDLGGPDWEKALVETLRVRGLLSRTEDTYRSWAKRFARFIAPKSPYAAAGEEVSAFLTDLAVQNRASPSSQRQALNALVFLMQQALGRDLGELDFKRAYPKTRVPIVLTPEECQRVFNQLEGTTRLMAELMYGSGIRLMELLRLRVHHLDLDRGQLTVRSGKRDKDRITIIPQSLNTVLQRQFDRLRMRWCGENRQEQESDDARNERDVILFGCGRCATPDRQNLCIIDRNDSVEGTTRISGLIFSAAVAISAIAGIGAALLPASFARNAGLIELVDMAKPFERTPWITVHQDLRRLPHIRAIMNWIAESFRQSPN